MKARLIAIATAVFLAAIAVPASADCIYPKSPESPPNGNTATEPEMVAGMAVFKKYDAEVTAYLSCLDMEASTRIAEAGDRAELIKQIKTMTDKKHNAAIDELSVRAEEFNSQLRAYKAKRKG